jgi:O-antigen/teichoic acid export membrane protein
MGKRKQYLIIIGSMLLFFAGCAGFVYLVTDSPLKEWLDNNDGAKDLGYIYLHLAVILICYWAVYGFMPTVRYKNDDPASWPTKIRDFVVCAIAIGFLAYAFSYRHGDVDDTIWITRFIEFIIPAFYGMYKANRKDANLSWKERSDNYHKNKTTGSGKNFE